MKPTFFLCPQWFSSLRINPLCLRSLLFSLVIAFKIQAQVPLDPQLAALPTVQRIMQAPVFRDPIDYIGDQAPDPTESEDLWAAIEVMRQNGPAIGIPALELFVQTYSNSVWTPSLENNLGVHYANKGRHSVALAHWQAAWEATKGADSGSAKAIADFALAYYTRLLTHLGWSETLGAVLEETQGR